MWDRGSRHLPLTPRYMNYDDNRPILPQDGTRGYFFCRKEYDADPLIYYNFLDSNKNAHIICSNVMSAADRTIMRNFGDAYKYMQSYQSIASLVPTLILYGGLTKASPTCNAMKPMYKIAIFGASYWFINRCISVWTDIHAALFYNQYYAKYAHLAKGNINEISDPKRKFFKPDTSVYYRETPQEIYDQKSASQMHDSSIYLGPHPFNDHENVDAIMEINKKFFEGESSYDKKEQIFGEDIDIKRRIKELPTVEEYRNI